MHDDRATRNKATCGLVSTKSLEHLAFRGAETLERETPLRDLRTTLRHHAIHLRVRMARIVVEEHQPLGLRLLGELQGIKVGGMPPAHAVRVFLWRVLGILDEEIRLTCQGHVIRRVRQVLRGRRVPKGFVVRGIRQDGAVDREAIAQGTAGVIDQAGFYTYCISRRNLRGGIHLRVR